MKYSNQFPIKKKQKRKAETEPINLRADIFWIEFIKRNSELYKDIISRTNEIR